MARRKRRVKRRSRNTTDQKETPSRPDSSSGSESSSSSASRHSNEAMLREEYAYVVDDLRKMAVIAAGMFTLLIVLGLVL